MDHLFAWLMGLLAFIGLGHAPERTWNGYAEVDYVYAAAATAGRIDHIDVGEGEAVALGDVLFVLDASQQQAQYDAALELAPDLAPAREGRAAALR